MHLLRYQYSYTENDGCWKEFSTPTVYDDIAQSNLQAQQTYEYCLRAVSSLGYVREHCVDSYSIPKPLRRKLPHSLWRHKHPKGTCMIDITF